MYSLDVGVNVFVDVTPILLFRLYLIFVIVTVVALRISLLKVLGQAIDLEFLSPSPCRIRT